MKHLPQPTGVDALVEKRQEELDRMSMANLSRFRVEDFIDDLKSLQQPTQTEERWSCDVCGEIDC
jgi:hypothetical protein